MGDSMGDFFQPWHLLLLLIVALFFLVPAVFYVLTLQRALAKCAPASRTLEPGMVWLSIIPVVSIVVNFFIVFGMAKSLRNEFNLRGIPVADSTPGQAIGLAMSICACCGVIPILGLIAGAASLVLWILYWLKVAEYSRMLDGKPQQIMPPAATS